MAILNRRRQARGAPRCIPDTGLWSPQAWALEAGPREGSRMSPVAQQFPPLLQRPGSVEPRNHFGMIISEEMNFFRKKHNGDAVWFVQSYPRVNLKGLGSGWLNLAFTLRREER